MSFFQGVPRSMSEIYKISNRNRHRNKEKKKLRESIAVPVSVSTESFDYFSHSKRQKGDKVEENSTESVLNEIGWEATAVKEQVSRSTAIAQKGTMGHYKTNVNSSAKTPVNPYLVNDMS